MSRVEELIEELCPDGVEWVEIKDIFDISAGGDVPKEQFSEEKTGEFIIPILSNGIEAKSLYGWTNKSKIDKPSLTISARGTIGWTSFRDYPFFPIVRLLVLTPKINIDLKYAYYFMKMIENDYNIPQNGIPQLTKPMISKLQIPIPPLPIQEEIVRILDTFTELTNELQKELANELNLRKKQYEYYRDTLLTFGEEVEWKTIKEVADNFTGLTYTPTDITTKGTLVLRSSNIKNNRLCFDDNIIVDKTDIPKRAMVQDNDILICIRNGSTHLIGKAAIIQGLKEPVAFGAFMTILRAKKDMIHYKFLFYLWQSSDIQFKIKGDPSMPIHQITNKQFSTIKIPIPSLTEQQRIVDILDRFDTLTNDLSQGLPAEIEMRQKQYEYYRDKLLTFKPIHQESV